MAIRECGNGHVYDPDQFSSCPYCGGGSSNVINFSDERATTEPGKTVAPSSYHDRVGAYYGGHSEIGSTEPGQTVAPENYRRRVEEPNKTVILSKKKYDKVFVVGWLTCIEGPEQGKAYHLWSKINTIGRGKNMDVSINDGTVSENVHAELAYDERHNNFYLIRGKSENNVYLNDEPVYTQAKLNAYDLIELGTTKLIFVPLCGDRFKWNIEMKQGG